MIIRRVDRHFIIISSVALVLSLMMMGACDPDRSDDPIPIINFPSATLNLALPEYTTLRTDGGFKTVTNVAGTSVGVRGIIIYRKDPANFFAYEVNCSYHPNEAGSNVSVHSSGLFMVCTGCGSNFSFDSGLPTGGIAWRPLRKYRTELSGSGLTITSEIVN